METTHELTVGQVVRSKSGRDKDRIFIVMDIVDEYYVMIADGDLRKWDKPKKKKVKHLAKYNIVCDGLKSKIDRKEKISNLLLRRELEKLELN